MIDTADAKPHTPPKHSPVHPAAGLFVWRRHIIARPQTSPLQAPSSPTHHNPASPASMQRKGGRGTAGHLSRLKPAEVDPLAEYGLPSKGEKRFASFLSCTLQCLLTPFLTTQTPLPQGPRNILLQDRRALPRLLHLGRRPRRAPEAIRPSRPRQQQHQQHPLLLPIQHNHRHHRPPHHPLRPRPHPLGPPQAPRGHRRLQAP